MFSQAFRRLLDDEYDVLFVVVSRPYLLAVADALSDLPDDTTAFAFAAAGSKDLFGDCHWVPATETERSALETTWLQLRGELFERFASTIDEQEPQELPSNPALVRERTSDAIGNIT